MVPTVSKLFNAEIKERLKQALNLLKITVPTMPEDIFRIIIMFNLFFFLYIEIMDAHRQTGILGSGSTHHWSDSSKIQFGSNYDRSNW